MALDPAAFVREAKARGASDETVLVLLTESGCPERDARVAVARYNAETLGIALPPFVQPTATNPLDAFLYVFAGCTLISWVSSALYIISALIDRAFPPPGRVFYEGEAEFLIFPLATILTTSPIYIALMVLLLQRMHSGVTSAFSKPRQWVISGTLLIGVATILTYVIVFVAAILAGKGTLAGFWKTTSAILLVGGLMTFYIRWLQSPGPTSSGKGKIS